MTNRAKVLLIGPHSRKEDAERSFMAPALGILRLAGFLNINGHEAESYDPNLHMLTGKGPSLHEVISKNDWDFIGVSILEETLIKDIENLYLAQDLCPNATLIAGGIEAQFNYQTILDKSPCNIVILSEGEISLLQLVNGVPIHEISGIVFKNKSAPLSQEIFDEATSAINWEENLYEDYWNYYISKYGRSVSSEELEAIRTVRVFSRNRCPIGCKFCSSTNQITWGAGNAVPVISATEDTLVDTIARIKRAHPDVKTIYLTDDDFCINKRSVIRFCEKIIERDFGNLTFMCFARASDLTDEMCAWMKKANFRRLNIGIESFSQDVLDEMGKRCSVQQNHEGLAMVKRHGIRAFINTILITPKTTIDDLEATVDSALKYANDDFYHVGVTLAIKPLKGTEFYEMYSDYFSDMEQIPRTGDYIQRDDFILADNHDVRAIQLKYWHTIDNIIHEITKKDKIAHAVAQNLSVIKLIYVKKLIAESRAGTLTTVANETHLDYSRGNSILSKAMPHNERQTVDLPESVGGISHPSSKGEKSVHGRF
jgi:radical SAM superfamily enzyme YgiQ (UPF0313 family)